LGAEKALSLDLRSVVKTLKDHFLVSSIITAACLVVALLLAEVLPKRYKAHGSISIYGTYFQAPLVRDFVPEVSDSSELRAQRESLIRRAMLDREFLDRIGEKYHLFRTKAADPLRSVEREGLQARMEILPLGPDTIQVGFIASDAQTAQSVANDLLTQITHSLLIERRRILKTLSDAARAAMAGMGLSVAASADPTTTAQPAVLKRELQKVQARLDALSGRYTGEHPEIVRLRERAVRLKKILDEPAESRRPTDDLLSGEPIPLSGPQEAKLEVYKDLLKKTTYLDIAAEVENEGQTITFGILEYPALPGGPIFPKRRMFILWGLLGSLFASAALGFLTSSVRSRAASVAGELAASLGSPGVGKFPRLVWKEHAPE
jgi:uncharacterized protein involved in exopolysaccharide biosynthesis